VDRGELNEELKHYEQRLSRNPQETKLRFKTAELAFQAGDFIKAKKLLKPLYKNNKEFPQASLLMGKLEYLSGNYNKAENIMSGLLENSTDQSVLGGAVENLLLVHYQTNHFKKIADLFQSFENEHPYADWAQSFNDEKPYQLDWHGQTETSVPFLITDPLPIVEVEVQGTAVYALLDTGGDAFILDTELAESLGIRADAAIEGEFGGGKETAVGLAKTQEIKIGDVKLHTVPIHLLPMKQISDSFSEIFSKPINGVIGTGVLKQFMATFDYQNARLILRDKTFFTEGRLKEIFDAKDSTEIPFFLSGTHSIMAKGSLNGKNDLMFFVDSGLGDESACFSAPEQTLEYVGIPVPEISYDPDNVGGGGAYASGYFPIKALALGALQQMDIRGEYGSMPRSWYWEHGFIQDGLISHQFLRQYDSWTIDFARMKMIFMN
jgi:tetratricopeptide (TPR) repeat protein